MSSGRPMICGGGCGCGPGRGIAFRRTYSAASWGSWERKACAAASPAAPAHDVVSCGLAGSMVQLARSIINQRRLQSSLASVLREEFPEDGLRKGVLVSGDVAISIDAAGMSLASTNLDDNPLLVIFSGRRMLDREDN